VTLRLHLAGWPAADLAARLESVDAVVCTAGLACDAAGVERCRALLSPSEQERLASYSNAIVARRFARGRALVREVVGSVLGLPAAQVPLREGIHGKPCLAAGTVRRVWFSVSHTDDLLVVALSRVADVGVDVERARALDQWQRVADRVLDAQERRQLAIAVEQGSDPSEALLRLWCRVEAELKAVGCGIQGLEQHLAGQRPRGLRFADLAALPLPEELRASGVYYHAAVALVTPGAGYGLPAESRRHTVRESAHDASPVASPARASTA
jgi:phosphopantetheinyl transferase